MFLGETELTHTPAAGGNPALTTWVRHCSFDGQAVAARDGNNMTDVQVLINDPHNTTNWAVETGGSQTILSRRTLPYGGERGTTSAGLATTRGFVGGTNDPATSLVHIGARQYDTTTGRFIGVCRRSWTGGVVVDHAACGVLRWWSVSASSGVR